MALKQAGFFVSVVNAILIHRLSDNSLRKVKTDRLDTLKIASYCLNRWAELKRYFPDDQIRLSLKMCCRQYEQYSRLKVNLKNNLIALLDGTFPGINTLFKSAPRTSDGYEKWIDFADTVNGAPNPGTGLARRKHPLYIPTPALRCPHCQIQRPLNVWFPLL